MNYNAPLSHRLENNVRTLKKPVLSYFTFLNSPLNPPNKPTGKRIIDMHSLRESPAYAGSRTRTPGMISVREPWNFRGEIGMDPESNLEDLRGRQFVFSSFYRPQVRVNYAPQRSQDISIHSSSRIRKPVPGCPGMNDSLRGPLICFETKRCVRRKHPTFSIKLTSPDHQDRRVRRDHPEISPRMRRGSDVGSILKKHWDTDTSIHSSRSTTCSF